jgi:hypothetical protein
MRSVRSRLLIVAAVAALALAVLAPSAAASSAKDFSIAKDCANLRCVVTASTYKGIPVDSVINYTQNTDGTLTAVVHGKNGTATGHCDLSAIFGTPSAPGSCVFNAGTGALTQFHLDVDVTVTSADFVSWAWNGSYWFGAGG